MKKRIFLGTVFFICFCTLIANRAVASTEVTSDVTSETTWDEAGSPYLVYGSVSVSAPLTIKPGVIVKFQYYGIGPTGILSVKNELNAVGTPEKPITFTSIRDDIGGDDNHDSGASKPGKGDWYGINIYNNTYNSKLEYVSVRYATTGIKYQDYSSSNYRGLILRNSEIKYNEVGIKVYNTLPVVENNKIENNKTGIEAYTSKTGRVPTFYSNSITGNTIVGLDARDVAYSKKVDARHNWWGDVSGPSDPAVNGNRVLGSSVMYDPWLLEPPQTLSRKPVILVPGIGASVNWDLMLGGVFPEKWTLMSHTYDGIVEALKAMGYREGKDLFVCYYDWRGNNAVSAENYLKPVIDKALSESGAYKVNIVAHSMGGLVARSYIQNAGYNDRNDVDNLILIGTPNKGSSDIYPVWEGGRIPKNWETRLVFIAYIDYLRVKNFTYSPYQIIHDHIPSVKELMPVYNYLHPVDNPNLLYNYAQLKEINNLLPGLNSQIGLLNDKVKVISISGNGYSTVNKIPFISAEEEAPLWIDGKPEPIDPVRNDTSGDKRVLLSSSQIQSYFSKTLDFDHGDIVDQSETLVADLLGENLSEIHPSPEIRDEIDFWFASPVDVEIKDSDGKIITKDFSNIENGLAQYSGETKSDGFKFISIPNPIKGDYKVKLTGNGIGEYHIGSIYADFENDIPDQESLTEGLITEGQTIEYKLEYNPDNTEDPIGEIKLADTTPPTITVTSPEEKEYLNDQIITVAYSISDETSPNEKIEKSITYDGAEFLRESIDFSLQHLGEHRFKITAADEAGNASEKEIAFQNTTNLGAIQNNISRYFDLGLIKKKIARKYLTRKLEHLKELFDLLEKIKNSKLKPKPKEAAIDALEKIIDADIDRLIKKINRRTPRWFDQSIAELLIESLAYLKME
jgi:pimeloyl-ACP methyl ester carboxylesterase